MGRLRILGEIDRRCLPIALLVLAIAFAGAPTQAIETPIADHGGVASPKWQIAWPKIGPNRSHVKLTQQVRFYGPDLEVCRTIRNIGEAPVTIPPLTSTTDSYGQFSTITFDARGNPWVETSSGFVKDSLEVPPPPSPSGQWQSLTLKPKEDFHNCIRFRAPKRRSYSVVSAFAPLSSYLVQLGGADTGAEAISNICYIQGWKPACDE